MPSMRLIIDTESERLLLEDLPCTLYSLTHPQGDCSPTFSAPHVTSLLLRVLNINSQADLLATELSAASHIQVLPCLPCCRVCM